MLNKAIDEFYTEYSRKNEDEYREEYHSFHSKFLDCHKNYANVAYPPPVFTREFLQYMKDSTEFLLDMVFSIPERIFNNDYRAMITCQGYKAEDAECILRLCTPDLLEQAKLTARPDFLLTPDGLRVVEMNVASAIGGPGMGDRHAEMFFRTKLAADLYKNGYIISFYPLARNWANFLYRCSKNTQGKADPMVMMALLSRKEMEEDNLNSLIGQEVLNFTRLNGFRTAFAELKELEFRDDGVYYMGLKIDIVLTSFIFMEARDAGLLDICDRLVEAHHRGQITFFGSATSTIFDHKMNLAIISSDEFSSYFSKEERAKIDSLVPRTVRLTEANKDEVLDKQEKLVLKKCISFAGKHVLIGKNHPKQEWEDTINKALKDGDSYIAQEVIENRIKRQVPTPDGVAYYDMILGGCYFDGFAGLYIRERRSIADETTTINISLGRLSMGFYCEK